MTGTVITFIDEPGENAISLRTKVQSGIKYFKGELQTMLSVSQQKLTPSLLCHSVLAAKIRATLQLK
jgi:hypothetical protein